MCLLHGDRRFPCVINRTELERKRYLSVSNRSLATLEDGDLTLIDKQYYRAEMLTLTLTRTGNQGVSKGGLSTPLRAVVREIR